MSRSRGRREDKKRLPVRVLEACRKVGLSPNEVRDYSIGEGEIVVVDTSGRRYEFVVVELNEPYRGRF